MTAATLPCPGLLLNAGPALAAHSAANAVTAAASVEARRVLAQAQINACGAPMRMDRRDRAKWPAGLVHLEVR